MFTLSAENALDFANRALQAYPIQPSMVTFLLHSENMTFRVHTSQVDYLLRVHSPVSPSFGDHGADQALVNSEMLWLAALQKARFPAPPPQKNLQGEYTTRLEDLNVTLLKWQEGDPLTREKESERSAAQIGTLVGRLHQFSARWQPPHGFKRPTRDAAYFERAMLSLWVAVEDGRINAQDYNSLQTVISWLASELRSQGRTRETHGLLHGDLHRGNFLLQRGRIRLIDFSMSAFGPYAYELGTCLSNIRPVYRSTFLENYCKNFKLPESYERLIEAYFIASWVTTFSIRISDPETQEMLVERVPLIANEYATRFNRDERFWFNERKSD